jgi:hypothetical protein
MAAITRNPSNRDILQSTKFKLNLSRLPGVTYFCQTVNLPGCSLTEVIRNTPFIDLYSPGEKLIYDTLNVTFLVNEDLSDWEQLHDWIRGMTFPHDFKEYADLAKQAADTALRVRNTRSPPQFTDASVTVFTNKNNPQIRLLFKDLFPTSLGGVQFSSLDSAENIITCDATFRFSYYNFERIS